MRARGAPTDAALYGAACLFALLTAAFGTIPIHREWGRLAATPYGVGAAASVVLALRRSSVRARAFVAVVVVIGAALVPLALEVAWRARTAPGLHAQSEAIVTEEAANALVEGSNPYAETYLHGPLAARPLGTKTHFPYLPGMVVFGLPRAVDGHGPIADARVAFAAVTLGLGALALARWRAPAATKVRATQFLAVLPTGALLMATGGDDLPVLALLLLALVLAVERRPAGSGIALGVALAMKQTAWIVLPFLAVAILKGQGRRSVVRFGCAVAAIALPVIAAFVAWDPRAFWEDAVLFPLGLGKQPTPAGTATLGSLLVDVVPAPHAAVTATLMALLVAVGLYLLVRRPPGDPAGAAARAAILFLAAFVLAPAARLGYLVYPIDLMVWGGVLGNASLTPWSGGGTAGSGSPPRRRPARRRSSP
jgi:glycosyl transferase family 87